MAAVLRDSVLYDKLHVQKYVADARDRTGRVVPIPFELTVVSPSTAADTYNLCVLPANCEVVGIEAVSNALGASAGTGVLVDIGDSVDPDRFVDSWDADLAESHAQLAFAGQRYRPAADTVVVALFAVAPVVGRVIKGCFYVVPGA
jgi:hypothetical protein